ncbi:hypothetical protein ACWD0J_35205 [Streptomyces sp. NPDC003011]
MYVCTRQGAPGGSSAAVQREPDTCERVRARGRDGVPDPELKAAHVQFGRCPTLSGPRGSLPVGLQGPRPDGNKPDWTADHR